MTKNTRPDALLPKLTVNKKYIKKMKFQSKKKSLAAAAERGVRGRIKKPKTSPQPKAKSKTSPQPKAKSKTSPQPKAKSKTSPQPKAKSKTPPNPKAQTVCADAALLARAIRGESEIGDAPPRQSLAFLEDYAAHRREADVPAEELLRRADRYFRDFGKQESLWRRAASHRLREMKAVNRRGGDADGFRYVVPRNEAEVVRQMRMAAGETEAAVDPTHLTSTFGGGEELTPDAAQAERPVHRKRKRQSAFADFYQFQVSRRWTRNAENFLNKGRAHKSMFEAKRQQRSIKKF